MTPVETVIDLVRCYGDFTPLKEYVAFLEQLSTAVFVELEFEREQLNESGI